MGQQPSSAVDVCNLALDAVGQAPIASILAPQTPSEDICARWYDHTRRKTLRDYIFNFARKPALLASAKPPVTDPGFANAYALPPDFIRLLTIGDRLLYGGNVPTQLFNVAQGFIYCDNTAMPDVGVTGLQIEYIYDAVLVPAFDPDFVEVLALRLGKAISRKFKLSEASKKSLEDDLEEAEMKAAAISGQEKPVRRVQRSRVRDVRRSNGIFTNNTVI